MEAVASVVGLLFAGWFLTRGPLWLANVVGRRAERIVGGLRT